jgi:hypothetical protein
VEQLQDETNDRRGDEDIDGKPEPEEIVVLEAEAFHQRLDLVR